MTLLLATCAAMAVAGCAAAHTTTGPVTAASRTAAACGTVQLSVGGKPQPMLQITDSFIPQVLKLAGLPWKVP